jgi:hypothetical protein
MKSAGLENLFAAARLKFLQAARREVISPYPAGSLDFDKTSLPAKWRGHNALGQSSRITRLAGALSTHPWEPADWARLV